MAVPGTIASRSNVGELLKPVFDDEIQKVYTDAVLFKHFQKAEAEDLDGEDFVVEVQTRRNARASSFSETEALPDSGVAQFKQAKLRTARVAQPLQLSHELVMLADRDVATFSKRAAILTTDAKDALVKELNFQVCGDGSAVRATLSANVTGGSATATVTVDSTQHFEEDMRLDIWKSDYSAQRNTPGSDGYFVVASIDSDTQITVSMSLGGNVPAGIVSTDVITKAASRTASVVKDLYGLRQICKSGDTFMGLAGGTYRRWNATVYDASAAAITPLLLGKAFIKQRRKVETLKEDRPDVIFTSPEQALALTYGSTTGQAAAVEFARADIGTLGSPKMMKPTVNLGYGEVTIESDLDLPAKEAFCFKSDAAIYGELHKIQLESWGGVTSLPAIDASTGGVVAADKMWFVFRGNIGCRRRNAFLHIKNLAALS